MNIQDLGSISESMRAVKVVTTLSYLAIQSTQTQNVIHILILGADTSDRCAVI